MVRDNAPELLRRELSSRKWKPQELAMSGVTDCYQPVERRLKLTRRCLAMLAEFRNPVNIVTKNFLVTRDEGVFAEQIHQMFRIALRKAGLQEDGPPLPVAGFRRPDGAQLALGF
jgi:DNA repair photolyase